MFINKRCTGQTGGRGVRSKGEIVPRVNTANHNISVLTEAGWIKQGNTTIFQKGTARLLSPAVSENSNGKYWFDLREVNLKRVGGKAILLVRVVPNMFVATTLDAISELVSERLKDNRPNSGNVWGLQLKFTVTKMSVDLFNIKDTDRKIRLPMIPKEEAGQLLNNGF